MFASFCGVAPIEVSSGDVVRHRLSRAGVRQLNYALHVMALAQTRYEGPGRSYYQRERAAGKSHHAPNAMDNFCFDVTLGYRRLELPRRPR